MFQLGLYFQKKSSSLCGLGAYVGVGEGVQDGAVNVNHKHAEKLLSLGLVYGVYERLQKLVELSHVYGIIGDAWHMLVEYEQAVQGFVEIRRRGKLKKLAALFHKFCVVRRYVTGAHRGVAFAQIADALFVDACIQKLIQAFRQLQYFH